MKFRSFIYAFVTLALVSCAKAEDFDKDIFAIIKGKVMDEADRPIEHMEVKIHLSKRISPKTLYSSSDGTFIFDITYKEAKNLNSISLTLTDTDGEENGGLFETLTEEIHLYDEERTASSPMMLNLDFHCSHATL